MLDNLAPWVEPEPEPRILPLPTEEAVPLPAERPSYRARAIRSSDVHRLMPQSTDAELGLLCSFLLDCNGVGNLCLEKHVTENFFHVPAHRLIYNTLLEMWNGGDPIDFIVLTQILKQRNQLDQVGGPAFISELFTFVPTALNASIYVELLRESFTRRKIITEAADLSELAYESSGEEMPELITKVQAFAENLTGSDNGNNAEEYDFRSLLSFDVKNDPDCLLGDRWLCRGGVALWIGQAGTGKSALLMQAAMCWAAGTPLFGIKPIRPLRSLVIQNENDKGDMAEMAQGVMATVRHDETDPHVQDEIIACFQKQIIFERVGGCVGEEFGTLVRSLLRKHKGVDLVWIDPLHAFADGDISKVEDAKQFLRIVLDSIAKDFGVGMMLMHHTGKPSSDPKSKSHWTADDVSYMGFGSSELTNYPRAIIVLQSIGDGNYELLFGKRRNRSGATDSQGSPTETVFLRHSEVGIYWDQIEKPEGIDDDKPKGKVNYREAILNELSVLDGVKAAALQKLISEETGISKSRFYQIWDALKNEHKVTMREGVWFKASK